MSVLDRLRAALDAPRFCPDCGQDIDVRLRDTFDPKTGQAKGRWVWSCPEVYLTVTHRGIVRASQTGDAIHPYGEGRPRWHRFAVAEPERQP